MKNHTKDLQALEQFIDTLTPDQAAKLVTLLPELSAAILGRKQHAQAARYSQRL